MGDKRPSWNHRWAGCAGSAPVPGPRGLLFHILSPLLVAQMTASHGPEDLLNSDFGSQCFHRLLTFAC